MRLTPRTVKASPTAISSPPTSSPPRPASSCWISAWRNWEPRRSEEHTSELQSLRHLVCRLLLEKKKNWRKIHLRSKGWMVLAAFLALPRVLWCVHAVVRPAAPPAGHELHPSPGQFFFFNDTAPPEIYPLPLPDAFPI